MSKYDILAEHGVYRYLGYEIPSYKEIGLNPDKVYQVFKSKGFIEDFYRNVNGCKIPLYLGGFDDSNRVGVVDDFTLFNGYIEHNVKLNKGIEINNVSLLGMFFSCPAYIFDCSLESGYYDGIHYDIVMFNPRVKGIYLSEKRKERINP